MIKVALKFFLNAGKYCWNEMRRNNSLQFRIFRYVITHNKISEFDDNDYRVRPSDMLMMELPSQQWHYVALERCLSFKTEHSNYAGFSMQWPPIQPFRSGTNLLRWNTRRQNLNTWVATIALMCARQLARYKYFSLAN